MVKKIIGCGRKLRFGRDRQHCEERTGKGCMNTPLSKKRNCGPTRVCQVNGDRKQCARMASLGIYPGNDIELICSQEGDRCLIRVHGGTMSIDRETMDNIIVSD